MESAIGQQFDRGTKFTVTVTVGEEVAPRVPFVNKGVQGFQLSQSFWTVSPLAPASPQPAEDFFAEVILTMELLDNNAASLSDNRLAPLKSVYFGSNEGRGPVPSVQP